MTMHWKRLVLVACLIAAAGCARHGVTGLAQIQDDFYTKLATKMKADRDLLQTALDEELAVDRTRQANLVQWQRDLAKAEIILQQRTGDVKGQERLLAMKLAESDLNTLSQVAAVQTIGTAQRDAILDLYDKVKDGAEAVAKNNRTILQYLESSDARFAVRSLDVSSLVHGVSALRDAAAALGVVQKLSDEEAKKRSDALQRSIERARDVLVKVFAK